MKPIPIFLLFAAASITAASSASDGQPLTLDQALKSARNRPALASARLKIAASQHEARSLGFSPALSAGAGLSTHPDLGASDQDLFLRQPLDLFGRTSAGRAMGRVREAKAQAEAASEVLAVQTEVMNRFFEAYSAAESVKTSSEISDLADKVLAATQRRFEEGRIPEVQVLRAEIERDRARQLERLLKSQKESAFKLLAGAIGAAEPILQLQKIDLDVVSGPLEQRPDVLLAQAEIDEVKAEAKAAKSSLMPELDLYGLRSGWSVSSPRYGARLQVTWNLWDQGKGKTEAKAFALKESALAAAKQDVLAKARSEVDALEVEIKAAEDQAESYAKLVSQAKILVEKSQKGFSEGVGTLLEVLESTRALREVEQESIAARLRLNLLKTAWMQASGIQMESIK